MTALDFYKERLKDRGFSEKQIKDLTDHKDLPWLQFAEDYHTKQLILSGVVSSKKPYYMLVNKNGNPITTDSKLPIFWLKKIARKEAVKFKADIKKIYL